TLWRKITDRSALNPPLAARIPFLIVIALLGSITLIAVVVRLTERLAVSPWEPAIAMEAARLNAGLPLYEAGHATHMYGPLLTVLLAEIFRVTGLNLLAGRIGFSICAFAQSFSSKRAPHLRLSQLSTF